MNRIISINKPSGYTSRDIVNIISRKFNTKKVGHTGTLDPLAEGVLVICIGKYTKLVEIISSSEKEYIAKIILGIKTDTYDTEGSILEQKDASNILKENILNCLEKFKGKYNQEVPIYSAVKVNGKKLYEYARKNKKVELPKKEVNIKSIELISDIKYISGKCIFKIKTTVSKGTYIRSLINDIGEYLNVGAVMEKLTRTRCGNITLEECDSINEEDYKEIDINRFIDFKTINIDNKELEKQIQNGSIIDNIYNTNIVGFILNNDLISIYKTYSKDDTKLKPWKML